MRNWRLAGSHPARCSNHPDHARPSAVASRVSIHVAAAMLIVALLAVPAQAQDKPSKVTGGIIAVGASLGLFEIVMTESCLQQGSCSEANRFMPDGKGAGATAGRAALKAAGTTAMTVVLLKLRTKHPRLALVGSIGFAGFNGWLAARGFDHLRRGQR